METPTKPYQLLDSKEKWTRFANARDSKGSMCPPTDPEAVCWCAHGAVIKCCGDDWSWVAEVLENYIRKHTNFGSVESFNDNSSYEDVVSLLKAANI